MLETLKKSLKNIHQYNQEDILRVYNDSDKIGMGCCRKRKKVENTKEHEKLNLHFTQCTW